MSMNNLGIAITVLLHPGDNWMMYVAAERLIVVQPRSLSATQIYAQ